MKNLILLARTVLKLPVQEGQIIPHLCAPIGQNMNKRDRRIIRRSTNGQRNLLGTFQAQSHINQRAAEK